MWTKVGDIHDGGDTPFTNKGTRFTKQFDFGASLVSGIASSISYRNYLARREGNIVLKNNPGKRPGQC